MTRRAAHPMDCDCCICVDMRQLREMDKRTCDRCGMADNCDGRLKTHSFIENVMSPFYLDRNNRGLVDALAVNCKQWKTKT